MPFSEKYTNFATGSNMNGGTDEDTTPNYAATNGGWDSSAGVFTPASGDPSAVSPTLVGQDANVFNDGATAPVFIGRVTAVSSTTVTVSTTAKSGTAPTTSATGRSINVGGVWKGCNGAVGFPFGFITAAQTNAAGDTPRINFKSGTNYAITASMAHAIAGPVRFQGYTTTPGDEGKATIDGGTSGAAYHMIFPQSSDIGILDFILQNNGASGSDGGAILTSGSRTLVRRVVAANIRGPGFYVSSSYNNFIECEAYGCNQSNTASFGGFVFLQDVNLCVRCISHDNTGSNSLGFIASGIADYEECIADSNGAHGFSGASSLRSSCRNCDSYNNGGDGVRLANATAALFLIENCNFIKNGGWAINGSGAGERVGAVINCGFGSGTQANTSGTTTGLKGMVESGSITYAANVTPWVDPAAGDFRISLAAAKGTGRGTFTQTAASYAGTVGFPDIGSAQHQESAGGVTRLAGVGGGLVG